MIEWRQLGAFFGLALAAGAQLLPAQETITYELLEGSLVRHSWGATKNGPCLEGERLVSLTGSFQLVLDQKIQYTGGILSDFDLVGEEDGVAYRVTSGRSGHYVESRSSNAPTAPPPNVYDCEVTADVRFGDTRERGVSLRVVGAPQTFAVFPHLSLVLFRDGQAVGKGTCFELRIEAVPVSADLERFFRRGDVNGDGARDVADAVFLLQHLFSGVEAPPCQDAADADDDGRLNLSDAIYLLAYLFLGGAAPAVPVSFCGYDPTLDSLDCRGQPACGAGGGEV